MYRLTGVTALLAVVVGLAGAVNAALCSDPWYSSPFEEEPIVRPGQPGYDANLYGQQLFDRYESAVFSDDRLVVIGRFEPRSTQPFLHETLLGDAGVIEQGADAILPLEVEYFYYDAYVFSGVGVGDGRLVQISDRAVDLRVFVSEGGAARAR